MALRRLGISNPEPVTDTLIFTSDGNYLVSVLVTNGSGQQGSATVYIDPLGSGVVADRVFIIKNIQIEANNSLEVHKFAVNDTDEIYISGNREGFSFLAEGIEQTDLIAYSPKEVKPFTIGGSSHTLVFENIDRILNFTSSSPVNVNIPDQAGNPAPTGSRFYITSTQAVVTVTASAGVTLNYNSSYQPSGKGAYSVLQIIKTNPNEYLLFGDLALV
jgi:hypothetical protein